MGKYALIINYGRCTGCRECETACRDAHGYDTNEYGGVKNGLKIIEIGPFRRGGKDDYLYHAVPTAYCDHCESRISAGLHPACVISCPESCIKLEEIAQSGNIRTDRKTAFFTV